MTMNRFDLSGKAVLVTGAFGGIGLATCHALAAQRARVIACDRALPEPQIRDSLPENTRVITCDVADRASVAALGASVPEVDGLVLGAGILPFDDWMAADWDGDFDKVMSVNVRGSLNIVRLYFDQMCARGSGSIVFVGSASGRMGGMQAGPHYVASKGAIHALVRWFAQRGAAHGVTVSGVAPGSVDTRMLAGQPFADQQVPMHRMARAEEIAWPIAFLCSPAASYICGAVLDVNGGLVFS